MPVNMTKSTSFDINLSKKIYKGIVSGKKLLGIPVSFVDKIVDKVIFNKAIDNTKYGKV